MQIIRTHEYLSAIILLLGQIVQSLANANEMSSKSDMNWWKNAIIYHMNPQNVTPLNNVQDILAKLVYLKEDGFTTLWLNANLIDFMNLSSSFGSMEAFEMLLNQAKTLDIKIIIDLIVSYTSDKCEWFLKSVNRIENYTNFYIWSNSRLEKKILPDSMQLWHPIRKQFYISRSNGQQPELNFREPRLIQAIDKALIFWLIKGINGFRIDNLTRYVSIKESNNLVHHWCDLLNNYTKNYLGPERVIMISDHIGWKSFMSYYENEQGIRGAHIPLNFLLINDFGKNLDAHDLIYVIQKWLIYTPLQQIPNWVMCDCWMRPSTFNQIHFEAMQMILYTLPGISIIYNGEECYKTSSKEHILTSQNNRDLSSIRECISSQFGIENSSANILEVPKKSSNTYKALRDLKKQLVLRKGHFEFIILNKWVLAIKRSFKNELPIITIVNMGSTKQYIDHQNIFDDVTSSRYSRVLFCSEKSFYAPNSLISHDANLTLMAHEGIVLQVEYFDGFRKKSLKAERRDLIKLFMKSLNVVLVGLLFYKLWHNKWTKLNFYKENIW